MDTSIGDKHFQTPSQAKAFFFLSVSNLDRQDAFQSLWCGLRTLDEHEVSEFTLTTSKHLL